VAAQQPSQQKKGVAAAVRRGRDGEEVGEGSTPCASAPGPSAPQRLFLYQGGDRTEAGWHGAVPPQILKLMGGAECFASPLNTTSGAGRYFSAFGDVDSPFGSLRSFFRAPSAAFRQIPSSLFGGTSSNAGLQSQSQSQPRDMFEVNPPFDHEAVVRATHRLRELIDSRRAAISIATAADTTSLDVAAALGASVPTPPPPHLDFLVVLPVGVREGVDMPSMGAALALLRDPRYLAASAVMRLSEAVYLDGMQHRISARFTARFYTGLFLLSSEVDATSSSAVPHGGDVVKPVPAAVAASASITGVEGSATGAQRTTAQGRMDAIREAWIAFFFDPSPN
jgi:hypothetical protein